MEVFGYFQLKRLVLRSSKSVAHLTISESIYSIKSGAPTHRACPGGKEVAQATGRSGYRDLR